MTAAIAWALAGLTLLLPARTRPASPAAARDPGATDGFGSDRSRATLRLAVVAVGCACLAALGLRMGAVAAAVLCPGAAAGLSRLQRRTVRIEPDAGLPLVLDLVAAALRSGRPLADALTLAAPAAGPDVARSLQRVAGLSRLGAEPEQTWSVVARAGPLAPVAIVAIRSATSGIKLAGAFERLAAELRADLAAAATARAQRAGIAAMGPLAACFLPSFVCLGVVPVVVGIARTALDVVP